MPTYAFKLPALRVDHIVLSGKVVEEGTDCKTCFGSDLANADGMKPATINLHESDITDVSTGFFRISQSSLSKNN